jgi:hypothetical protein
MRAIRAAISGLILSAVLAAAPAQAGPAAELLTSHLESGKLAKAEQALLALSIAGNDPEANFALGAAKFLRAIEELGQSFHRHGLQAPAAFGAPLFRMPVPENPNSEKLTYAELRRILQTFVDRMADVDATLAKVGPAGQGEIKIALDLAKIRLDLDRDGAATDAESLPTLLAAADPTGLGLDGMAPEDGAAPPPRLTFAFDNADAVWLRGYSHVLAAFADFLLAHDFSALFDGTFHVLFPAAGLPMQDKSSFAGSMFTPDDPMAADAIAFIHLIRFPVAEAERMRGLRERLLTILLLSRENWSRILAETDDDREWLPSPRQTTPFPGLEVSENHVSSWLAFLDMSEALLEGQLLLPHWRFEKGIDLKRVFDEPRDFDVVMWLTGQGALPYLADGPVLSGQPAELSAFQGRLLQYALWFN